MVGEQIAICTALGSILFPLWTLLCLVQGKLLWVYALITTAITNYFSFLVIHRNCFIGFVACSILHMVCFLFLFKAARQPFTYRVSQTKIIFKAVVFSLVPLCFSQDRISFRLRATFFAAHILIFVLSLYFYWRHNTYCEPYSILICSPTDHGPN